VGIHLAGPYRLGAGIGHRLGVGHVVDDLRIAVGRVGIGGAAGVVGGLAGVAGVVTAVVAPEALGLGGEGGAQNGGVVGFEQSGDPDEAVGFIEQPDAAAFAVVVGAVGVVGLGGPPVGADHPGELAHRHLAGQIQPFLLGGGFGDLGHQPELGPAQFTGRGSPGDGGQLLELAAHFGLVGGGAQVDTQIDRRPVSERADADTLPTVYGVQPAQQPHQLGGGGVDVPRQLAQLGAELVDLGADDGRTGGGCCGRWTRGHTHSVANECSCVKVIFGGATPILAEHGHGSVPRRCASVCPEPAFVAVGLGGGPPTASSWQGTTLRIRSRARPT
jgi:hypothetical protein